MAELLSVPLKKPSEVDLVTPLKNLIQSRYSTADKPEDCADAINELAKLRNNAIWKVFEKYESSLEIIYGYDSYLINLHNGRPAFSDASFSDIMINLYL
jgi:programmed cell death 6-interacting protein